MAITKITSKSITDGTIATADIADSAISTAKIASGAVTSAKTTGVGGANTPVFGIYKSGDQGSLSANTWTKVTSFVEEFDPQSTWDTSNHKFTPAESGKYFIYGTFYVSMNDGSTSYIAIAKNGTRIIETTIPSGRTTNSPFQISAIVDSDDNDYFEYYVKVPVSSGTIFSNGVQTKCGAFKIIT